MELSAAVSSLFVGSLLLLVTPHSANGQKGNTYGGCEPGWLHYKRICYLIQGGHINWDAADKKCKQLGGKLADLGDLNRKSFVYSQLHNTCSDRNEEKCRKKADKGACLQDHDDMAKNCRFSCGYCTSLCENKDGGHFCKTYAKANWCNSDYKFMMKYCRLSCGCNGFTDRLWQQKDYITRRHLFGAIITKEGPYCVQLDLTTSKRYATVCTTASGAGYICEKPADNHYLPEADEYRKGCPVNSFGYEDKCYILNSHRIGWHKAKESCGGKSGTLASLHNQEILDFVRSELLIDTDSAWIGLSKRDSFWAWENGNNAEYIPWSADFDGTDINVCVEVVANENVTEFVPAKCSLKQPSVCEIPRKGLDYSHDKDDTTPRIIFSDCSKSWEEYGEYCYQYFPEAKTWSDAQSYCAGLRGSLISIHDGYTKNILKRFDQNKPAWIGLWKPDREKRYEWSDERPFDYYFWDTNNSDDRLKAQCIQADPKTKRWSGASCDSTKGFVCQIWRGHPAHIVQAATVTTPGSTTSTTTTQKKQPDTTQKPSTPLATNKASTTVQTSDTTPGRLATETVPAESASATAEPNPTTTEPKPRSTTPDSEPDLTTPEPTPPALKPKPTTPDTEPLVPKVETTTEASKPIILNPVVELEPDQTDEENSKPSLQKSENGVDKEGKSDESKDEKGGSGTSSWPISPIQLIAILVGCTVFVLIFSILFVYASRNSRKRQRLEAAARDERTLSIKYKNGLPDDEDDQSPSSLSTGVVNPTFSPVTFVNQAMDDSMKGDNRDLNFGSSGGFDNQIYNVSTA